MSEFVQSGTPAPYGIDLKEIYRDAERYRWLVENPGFAILAFAEATNVDTFGIEWKDDKPVRQATPEEYCRYLHARIDELMQERRDDIGGES